MREYFKLALGSLWDRKTRSFLTVIAIVIGVAAIVSLLSLGLGMDKTISDQFEAMGINKLFIFPGQDMSALGAFTQTLDKSDLDVVEKVNGVAFADPMLFKSAKIEYEDDVKYFWVIGLPAENAERFVEAFATIDLLEGKYPTKNDKYSVMIGYLQGTDAGLFKKAISLRDKIMIENREFKVVGRFTPIGNNQDDNQMYIPLSTARELFDEPDAISTIIVEVEPNRKVADVAEEIEAKLRKHRGVKEGEEDFGVQTSEELMRVYSQLFSVIILVVVGIGFISLIIGGIGITNTMYTNVLERTTEIGIMKSIGATNKQILFIFLIESAVLGFIGGVLGVSIGLGLAKLVELYAGSLQVFTFSIYTSPWLIGGALLFSMVVGIISGVMPARNAAGLKPVDALRKKD